MECEPNSSVDYVSPEPKSHPTQNSFVTQSLIAHNKDKLTKSEVEMTHGDRSLYETEHSLTLSDHNASVCSSVIIEIEEQEKTVIPDSDSGSETDFEERAEAKDANIDNADEVGESKVKVDQDITIKSSSETGESSEDELAGSDGENNSSQMGLEEITEALEAIERQNRSELQSFKRFSPYERIFPDVRTSAFHTVAITLTDDYKPGDALIPYPPTYASKWHKDYVPMPCCPENQRVVKRRVSLTDQESSVESDRPVFKEVTLKLWERIHTSLTGSMSSCDDIARAVRSYSKVGDDFTVLDYALNVLMSANERDKFFSNVLPGMVQLCLSLPEVLTCPLPFLFRFMNYSITLSQKQIACLLANAFFSTFPHRFSYEEDFPSINFASLLTGYKDDDRLSSRANKLRCILHYFERVIDDMPKGVVTYTRKSVRTSKTPDWSQSQRRLSKLITLHEGTIETEGERLLQVDFANKYIGGGVLGHGCVQEEILFVIYPELLISRLFSERLVSCEALVVTGCERFSAYRGYARSFEYGGDFVDCTPWNSRGRKCTQIVAIDALYITKHTEQFHPQKLTREVNKAFIGFCNPPGTSSSVAVATGKWGCGAFRGDAHLKAILQLLAASQAGRSMVFFTFGDLQLQKELEEIYQVIKDKLTREIWTLLQQYYKIFCSRQQPKMNLHQFFTQYTTSCSDVVEADTKVVEYPSASTRNLSPKKQQNSSPRRPKGGMNLKQFILSPKRLSEGSYDATSGTQSGDWLQKLNDTKSGWSTVKPVSDILPEREDKKLSDEQICALLEEEESMEVDTSPEELSERPPQLDGLSGIVIKDPAPFQPPLINKRTNPTAGDSHASFNASGIPKQKRQMTLHDFYKPIQD